MHTAWAYTTAQAEPTTTVIATNTVTSTRTNAPAQAPSPTEAPTSPNRLVETAAAYRTKVARLTPSATLTPLPTATSIYPVFNHDTEMATPGASGIPDLHGVILFRSRMEIPFPELIDKDGSEYRSKGLSRICTDTPEFRHRSNDCLWALAPDGKSAVMLSTQNFDTYLYLPPNGPPLIVENGFVTNHPGIQPVRLPEICSQDPASGKEQRCNWIRLTSDGRYLGFRYGEESCAASPMQIINRITGAVVLKAEGGVFHLEPLPNGKIMIYTGSCNAMEVSFFDPVTRQSVYGGGVTEGVGKNLSGTIYIGAGNDFYGQFSELWGYNLKTGGVFRPEGKQPGKLYDEHVIFLPDDRRFLYQHLLISIDKANNRDVIDIPAQIVRYDPISGQRKVLASDPAYHYRICHYDYPPQDPDPCPLEWRGDWIQVQRLPFTPLRPKGNDWGWSLSSELPCFADGRDCPAPPESFALNANTGELRPWDPAALPPANPAPAPTRGPDLNSQPVYTDPAGLFALYTGPAVRRDGGSKSLWMAPKEGPAVLWVEGGEDFFYLP